VEETKKDEIKHAGLIRLAVKLLIPCLLIVLAVGFMKYQIDTGPKAKKQEPVRQSRLVEVVEAVKNNADTVIYAMGTVVPAKRVTVSPEVSGKIVSMDGRVVPGGIVKLGEELVTIDPRDYTYAVKQRESEVSKAKLEVKVEYGNQNIAKQEYELLGELIAEEDMELVLRGPYLESAEASYEAAKAALEKAKIDLERCVVKAPFNALIQEKTVDVGTMVSQSTKLLSLAGTDEYWVEVLVPVSQLKWVNIPRYGNGGGARVKIYDEAAWGEGNWRDGEVIKLMGELESEGRMAKLLVSVRDPLSLDEAERDKPVLLLGSYVRCELAGSEVESAVVIDRDLLRDGDRVWVMDGNDSLEVRDVDVVFKDKINAYITGGLEEGERIVMTDISSPVAGMGLRLNDVEMDGDKSYYAEDGTENGTPQEDIR